MFVDHFYILITLSYLVPLLNWTVIQMLICRSSLYIRNSSPLTLIHVANFFSQIVICGFSPFIFQPCFSTIKSLFLSFVTESVIFPFVRFCGKVAQECSDISLLIKFPPRKLSIHGQVSPAPAATVAVVVFFCFLKFVLNWGG